MSAIDKYTVESGEWRTIGCNLGDFTAKVDILEELKRDGWVLDKTYYRDGKHFLVVHRLKEDEDDT